MTTVHDLCTIMEGIAPLQHAADWDNVGLLVGRRDRAVRVVLACIDLTQAVLDEACTIKAQAVLAYHPTLFSGRKRLTDQDPAGDVLLRTIESGIAVYSPHTALDAAPKGMADWLARGIGTGAIMPITQACEVQADEAVKVISYVPRTHAEAVRDAMSTAGAGHIGAYTHCSTLIESTGTFRPEAGANPHIGAPAEISSVDEMRVMMVCGDGNLGDVVAAIQSSHPYEEPPIHIVPLRPRPLPDTGSGRLVRLSKPQSLEDITGSLKAHLGVDSLRVSAGRGHSGPHEIAACCPGAGGSMLDAAVAAGATLFLTGEMRHHDVLAAKERGVSVVLAGHTNTERGYLPRLVDRLSQAMPEVQVLQSEADVAPWMNC